MEVLEVLHQRGVDLAQLGAQLLEAPLLRGLRRQRRQGVVVGGAFPAPGQLRLPAPELETFFGKYLEKDYSFFKVFEDYAAGFYGFLRAIRKGLPRSARFLKGSITGPLTAGISFKDETGKDIIHNDVLFDAVVKGLGADRFRRDIFLEVDVMTGLANPPVATAGNTLGTFDTACAVFAAAPIINPTLDNGIHLVIESSGTLPHWQTVGFTAAHNASLSTANYGTLKTANFDNAIRDNIYGMSQVLPVRFELCKHEVGPDF